MEMARVGYNARLGDIYCHYVSIVMPSPYYARQSSSSAAVKYGDSQLALFHVPGKGLFAIQQVSDTTRVFRHLSDPPSRCVLTNGHSSSTMVSLVMT